MRVPTMTDAAPRARALAALGRPLLLSLGNQMLSSGGNFLVGLYLARNLPLEQFGLFGICYGICMLYIGVGNAVLLTQMTVGMADQPAAARAAYAGSMLAGVMALGLALVPPALAAALWLWWLDSPYLSLVAPVTLTAALLLCAEFFISYAYVRHEERAALLVNGAAMATLAGGLLALHLSGYTPTAAGVLLLYAAGAALGSLLAGAGAPLVLRQRPRALAGEWRAAWRHGRWALGGVAISWIQAQSATYTLAAMLGPAGAGLANLSRLFISPFTFLLPAINKIVIPRLVSLRRSDPRRMRRLSTLITAALVLLAALYALVLLSCLGWLVPLVLGYTLPALPALVAVWCVVLLFQVGRSGGALLLQMQLKFKQLTLITVPSAALAVAAAVLLMRQYQEAGAIAGVLAGEMLLALLVWKEIGHGARAEHR
ncbi:hypothetical protein [Duganella aceris]|uniref:Oligosaccharide flippase family protein n=1 Tax=Duganella aceris TaxID=2703883 RepID=A0ABX0FJN3_9BURK|nr:hypothetical protein [Duganella aceris]NGZ84763.1 hypothetical protein [Duganella aceris]